MPRESFVSLAWRMVPYWLNNWEQRWGAECSSMMFELPHFALELLVVLPSVQASPGSWPASGPRVRTRTCSLQRVLACIRLMGAVHSPFTRFTAVRGLGQAPSKGHAPPAKANLFQIRPQRAGQTLVPCSSACRCCVSGDSVATQRQIRLHRCP